jgi:hypothetical protein
MLSDMLCTMCFQYTRLGMESDGAERWLKDVMICSLGKENAEE